MLISMKTALKKVYFVSRMRRNSDAIFTRVTLFALFQLDSTLCHTARIFGYCSANLEVYIAFYF